MQHVNSKPELTSEAEELAMHSGSLPQDYSQKYMALLPELRETARASIARLDRRLALLLPPVFIAGLELAWILHAGGSSLRSPETLLPLLYLAPLLLWLLHGWSRRRAGNRWTGQQSDWLTQSGLADRIAAGELLDDPLLDHLSRRDKAMAYLDPQDYRGHLLRVCRHFTWYLSQNKSAITGKSTWLTIGVALLLLVAMLCAVLPSYWPWCLGIGVVYAALAHFLLSCTPGETGLLLADYLKSRWERIPDSTLDSAEGGLPPAHSGNNSSLADTTERARLARMQLIFNDVEMRSLLANAGRSGALSPLLVVPVLFSLQLVYLRGISYWWVALVTILTACAFWRWKMSLQNREVQSIALRLAASELAAELARGELSGSEALEHAPLLIQPLLRLFQRRSKGVALRSVLFNISDNLDWYVGRRQLLLRPHWLSAFAVPLAIILVMSLQVLIPAPASNSPVFAWTVVLLFLLPVLHFVIARLWLSEKQAIWSKAMLEYLRQQSME